MPTARRHHLKRSPSGVCSGGGQPLRHPAGTSVAHPCAPPPEVDYGCERLTIQSGGTLNAALVREGLVDFVDVVVAPLVVGGRDTPTLVDGPSLTSIDELSRLCALELLGCEALRDSYVRLRYRVGRPS
ncbi:MAG: dihydrofolate reductase family protein [Atopobiaceae bacterium]|nr:dihydrofolate reductase family protein [Atopobiaceae bacterium]